ncbi:MAG: PASTA domain-containing protein, partial [Actinobacteria bacterium]
MARRAKTSAERSAPRMRQSRSAIIAVVLVAVIAAVAVIAGLVRSNVSGSSGTRPVAVVPAAVAQTSTVQAGTVEVPDVTGMRPADAAVVLQAAGLVMEPPKQDSSTTAAADRLVADQEPVPGALVTGGSGVALTYRLRAAGKVTPENAG